ncbi:unnamed protein product, partial [Brassica oleracea]
VEITTIYSVELEEDTFGEILGHQGAATRLRDGSTGLTLFTWKERFNDTFSLLSSRSLNLRSHFDDLIIVLQN